MKKNWFYVFLLMAVAVMPLTSCDKEDIPQPEEILKHDPESDADQSTVEAYDALEWLQGCIVLVDIRMKKSEESMVSLWTSRSLP